MDRERQKAVFTHFIHPFLSRNDSSGNGTHWCLIWQSLHWCILVTPCPCYPPIFFADPGCVSLNPGSEEWLKATLGGFSGFATLQELQALNPNFSSVSDSCNCRINLPTCTRNKHVPAPLQLWLFDFILISLCRWIPCQSWLLPRWRSWHWPQGPWMTRDWLTVCLTGLRMVMLLKTWTNSSQSWWLTER